MTRVIVCVMMSTFSSSSSSDRTDCMPKKEPPELLLEHIMWMEIERAGKVGNICLCAPGNVCNTEHIICETASGALVVSAGNTVRII